MAFLDLFDEALRFPNPNWTILRRAAHHDRMTLSKSEIVVAGIAERLCIAFQNASFVDAVALLRQFIRIRGGLHISKSLWSQVRERAETCGIIGLVENDTIELSARSWQSTWLRYSEQIDGFERRNTTPSSLGDGMLNAMRPVWTDYRSEAQKAAVDAWLFAPPGSTTLVTLPTGGGKSMCTVLPAWFDSRGGRVNSGTTLVVVPTVALALDQEKQAGAFFKGSAQPQCRTGASTPQERKDIEACLRDGSLPILFTSPESLLGSRLYEACLDAAEEGFITRFVIDEAHLIETWGAGFRPEFQLLSAFRRRMLSRSKGNLRTLLLSATVSERSREVLEQLFSEPGKLVTVQANRLRPEIGYWFDFAPNEYARNQRVLESIRFLPRPLILYVTRPMQAAAWEIRLRDEGYQRVACFTGETRGEERQALLDAWMSNQIDIMIGTSAFGLGVDKSDVRAIVHATLPENIDRFYQEVGRGGRDGYSASALLCTCPQDIDLAYSLSPKRITFEKAEPRWNAMLATPNHAVSGDVRRINREAVPIGKHRDAVEVDRDWNDHLLLLLQRAGAIQVVDISTPEFVSTEPSDAELMIRIVDTRLLDDPEHFRRVFERVREQEKDNSPTDQLLDIIKAYGSASAEMCLGRQLAEVYDNVQIACGGCTNCRQESREAYGGDTLDFQVSYPNALARQVSAAAPIAPQLSAKLGGWKSLNVTWIGARSAESLKAILPIMPLLARLGFQQLVIPDALFEHSDLGAVLIRSLAEQDKDYTVYPHRVIPVSWLVDRKRPPLLSLPTVMIYPPDDHTTNRVYQTVIAAEGYGVKLPACIHIVHAALRLTSAGKLFTEHVDGLTEVFDRFHTLIRDITATVN
ncbi:MAG: protein DpdF [Chloroflexota bacterium]